MTEKLDLDAIYRIKDEGLQRSKVMEIESYLTDVYGPRLTGSPNIKEAGDWAMKTMKDWGLANVHEETVAVRPRLAEPALHRERGDAARLSADRLSESMDARHQRPGHRRGDYCGHQRRKRFRDLQGQAEGQVRAVDADARRRAALRGAGTPLYRRRARRSGEAAAGRRRARTRQLRRRSGIQSQEGAVLPRRRRGGGARLQPRRRRHGLRPGAAGRVARAERPRAAGASDADRRTLRPDLANAGEEDPRHPADGHRQQVLRRRSQRLQHRRRAAGHRQGRRDRHARRALRLVAHRHRRHRQRRRHRR